jgi:hypothetical protein
MRAPSVVGQWQNVGEMRTVYPSGFADGHPIITPSPQPSAARPR